MSQFEIKITGTDKERNIITDILSEETKREISPDRNGVAVYRDEKQLIYLQQFISLARKCNEAAPNAKFILRGDARNGPSEQESCFEIIHEKDKMIVKYTDDKYTKRLKNEKCYYFSNMYKAPDWDHIDTFDFSGDEEERICATFVGRRACQ